VFNTSLKQLRLSETNNNIETVIGSPNHQSLTQTIHNDVSTILSSSFHLPQTDNTINIDILLHLAANEGNARKVSLLLNEGHDVNGIDKEGRTPLMYCVLPSGAVQLHCADILLQAGANLDQQAHDGSTVLHVASIVGSIPYMEMLLLNGSNPLIRDNDGRLPIHWSTVPTSAKPILLLLQESRCNVNVTDCSDMTPLMWACYHKNVTIAKQLLNEGADVEEKDYEGNTAMHWSVMKSDIECLQLLLKQDMTYFKNRNGCTVLHIAAREGFIRGIQYILTLRPDSIHDTDKMVIIIPYIHCM
jgi:ankyrin repeat protein